MAEKEYLKNMKIGNVKATTFGSNLKDSFKYTVKDVTQELIPFAYDMSESNLDLSKNIKLGFKIISPKEIVKKIKKSDLVDTGKVAYKNAKKDIKKGIFNNKKRQDEAMMKSMGFDMDFNFDDDINFDDSDFNFEDSGNVNNFNTNNNVQNIFNGSFDRDSQISSSIKETSIGNIKIRSAEHSQLMSITSTINDNLAKLVTFQTESTMKHYEETAKYYANTSELQKLNNEILTKLLPKESIEQKEEKETDLESVLNYNGTFNFQKYFGVIIKKNIPDLLDDVTMGFASMAGSMGTEMAQSMIEEFKSNPLGVLTSMGIKSLIPKFFKKSLEDLNETLSNSFKTLALQFNTYSKMDIMDIDSLGSEDRTTFRNGVKYLLGKLFKLDPGSIKNHLDTSRYEKGKVDFDGITRKAIIEVIPMYLRKILSTLSGTKDEIVYDYKEGKAKYSSDIIKEYEAGKIAAANYGLYDAKSKVVDYLGNKQGFSDINNKDMRDNLNIFFSALKDHKLPRLSDELEVDQFKDSVFSIRDINGKSNFNEDLFNVFLTATHNALSPKDLLNLANDSFSSRDQINRFMKQRQENIELEGLSQILSSKEINIKNSKDYKDSADSKNYKRVIELDRNKNLGPISNHLMDIKKILLDGITVFINNGSKVVDKEIYSQTNSYYEDIDILKKDYKNRKDFSYINDKETKHKLAASLTELGFSYYGYDSIENLANEMIENERLNNKKKQDKEENKEKGLGKLFQNPLRKIKKGIDGFTENVATIFYGNINQRKKLFETFDGENLPFDKALLKGINAMANRLDEFVKKVKDWFNPIKDKFKKFLFGEKEENGNLSGGILSSTGNMFKNAYRQTKHMFTGNEIKLTNGEILQERKNSVKGMFKNSFRNLKTEFFGSKEKDGIFQNLLNDFKGRFNLFQDKLFGKRIDRNKTENLIKKYAPNALFGSGLGLLGGLFLGGPALGTALGALTSISAKTGHLETLLFGSEKTNKNLFGKKFKGILENEMVKKGLGKIGANLSLAKTGGLGYLAGIFLPGSPLMYGALSALKGINDKTGIIDKFLFGDSKDGSAGIFAKGLNDKTKKEYKKFGTIGGSLGFLGGIFLPGGPLLHGTIGTLTGMAFKSAKLDEMLFGKSKNGKSSFDNIKQKITKNLSKIGIKGLKLGAGGILGNMLLPGGPIFAPLMGMYLSNKMLTKDFKTFLWGDYDPEKGTGHIGQIPAMMNLVKRSFVLPFKQFARNTLENMTHWLKINALIPLKYAFKPFKDLGKHLITKGKNLFKKFIFNPIVDRIAIVFEPLRQAFSKVAKFIMSPFKWMAKFLIKAPIKLFKGLSKTVERYNIKHGIGEGYADHYKNRDEEIKAEKERHAKKVKINEDLNKQDKNYADAIGRLQKNAIYRQNTDKALLDKRNEYITNYSDDEKERIKKAEKEFKQSKKAGFLNLGIFRSGEEKDKIAEASRNVQNIYKEIHKKRESEYEKEYAEKDRSEIQGVLDKENRILNEIIKSKGELSYEQAFEIVTRKEENEQYVKNTAEKTDEVAENTKETSEGVQKIYSFLEKFINFAKGNGEEEIKTKQLSLFDMPKVNNNDKEETEKQTEDKTKNKQLSLFDDNFAQGIENYKGGVALVGEEGPELVKLPQGSSVKPFAKTRQTISDIADDMVERIKAPFKTIAAAITVPFKLAKDMINFVTSIPDKFKKFKESVGNFFKGISNFGKKITEGFNKTKNFISGTVSLGKNILGFGNNSQNDNKRDFAEIQAENATKDNEEKQKTLFEGFTGMFKDTRSMATTMLDKAKKGLKFGKILFLAIPFVLKVFKGIKDFMNGGLLGLFKNSVKPGGFLSKFANNIVSKLLEGMAKLIAKTKANEVLGNGLNKLKQKGLNALSKTKLGKKVGSVLKKTPLAKVMTNGTKSIAEEGAELVAKNSTKKVAQTVTKAATDVASDNVQKSMLGKSFNKFLSLKPVKKVLGKKGLEFMSKRGFSEIAKKAGTKAMAKAGAAVMAAPVTAAFVAKDLVTGFTDAKSILKLPKGQRASIGMKSAAAIGKAIANNLLFGVVPESMVANLVYKSFSSEEKGNRLQELQEEFYKEVESSGLSEDQYSDEINEGFLSKFKKSLFGKKDKNGNYTKRGLLNPFSWFKPKRDNQLEETGNGRGIRRKILIGRGGGSEPFRAVKEMPSNTTNVNSIVSKSEDTTLLKRKETSQRQIQIQLIENTANMVKLLGVVAEAVYSRRGMSIGNLLSDKVKMDTDIAKYEYEFQKKEDERSTENNELIKSNPLFKPGFGLNFNIGKAIDNAIAPKVIIQSDSPNISYAMTEDGTTVITDNSSNNVSNVKTRAEEDKNFIEKAWDVTKTIAGGALSFAGSVLGSTTMTVMGVVLNNRLVKATAMATGISSLHDFYKNGFDSILGRVIKEVAFLPITIFKHIAIGLDKAILKDKNITDNIVMPMITYAKNNYGLFLNKQEKLAWKALKDQNKLQKVTLKDTFSKDYGMDDFRLQLLGEDEELKKKRAYKKTLKRAKTKAKQEKELAKLQAKLDKRGKFFFKGTQEKYDKLSDSVLKEQQRLDNLNVKGLINNPNLSDEEIIENNIKSNAHIEYYNRKEQAKSILVNKPQSQLDKDREQYGHLIKAQNKILKNKIDEEYYRSKSEKEDRLKYQKDMAKYIEGQKKSIENATKKHVDSVDGNTDAITKVSKAITKEGQEYVKEVSAMTDNVETTNNGIMNKLKDTQVYQNVSQSQFGQTVSNVYDTTKNTVSNTANKTKNAVKNTSNKIANTRAGKTVANVATKSTNAVKNVGVKVVNSKAGSVVSSGFNAVKGISSGITGAVGEMATSMLPDLIGKIPVIGPIIQSVPGLSGLISSAGSAITPLMSVLTPALPFIAAGGAIFALDKFGPQIEQFVEELPDKIVGFISGTIEFAFTKLPKMIWNAGKTLLRLIPKILMTFPKVIHKLSMKAFEGIKGIGGKVVGWFKDGVSNFFKPVKDAAGKVVEAIKNYPKMVKKTWSTIFGAIPKVFTFFPKLMLNLATKAFDKLKDIGGKVVGWFKDGVSNFFKPITEPIGKLVDGVKGIAEKVSFAVKHPIKFFKQLLGLEEAEEAKKETKGKKGNIELPTDKQKKDFYAVQTEVRENPSVLNTPQPVTDQSNNKNIVDNGSGSRIKTGRGNKLEEIENKLNNYKPYQISKAATTAFINNHPVIKAASFIKDNNLLNNKAKKDQNDIMDSNKISSTVKKSLSNPIIKSVASALKPIYGDAAAFVAPAIVGLTVNANENVLKLLEKIKPNNSVEENVTMKQVKKAEERAEKKKNSSLLSKLVSNASSTVSNVTSTVSEVVSAVNPFSDDSIFAKFGQAIKDAFKDDKEDEKKQVETNLKPNIVLGSNQTINESLNLPSTDSLYKPDRTQLKLPNGSGFRKSKLNGRGKKNKFKKFTGRGENNGFTYFNQNDSRWADQDLSNGGDGDTVASAGCGPTAVAMALSSRGIDTDPSVASSFAQSYKVKNEGISADYVSDYAASTGVSLQGRTVDNYTTNDIDMSLSMGQPVVALGTSSSSSNPYTSSGHYVTISGKDNNGNYKVSDPLDESNNSKSFKPDDLLGSTSAYWTDSSVDGSELDYDLTGMGTNYLRPVERSQSARVTSYYGNRVLGGDSHFHTGIDFGTQGKNSKIFAVADGVVTKAVVEPRNGKDFGYGTHAVIKHTDGHYSLYGHMKEMFVNKDMNVKRGDNIGLVGNSGWSTGPHLHVELRDPNYNHYNPAPHLENAQDPDPNAPQAGGNGTSSSDSSTSSSSSSTSVSVDNSNDTSSRLSSALGKLQSIYHSMILGRYGIEEKVEEEEVTTSTSTGSTSGSTMGSFNPALFDCDWESDTTNKRGDGPLLEMTGYFEASGDVGKVSSGKGDAGGVSYGIPQFTTKEPGMAAGTGSMKNVYMPYLEQNKSKFPNVYAELSKHTIHSSGFDNAFRNLGKTHKDEMFAIQDEIVRKNYYSPTINYLKSVGYDIDNQPKGVHSALIARRAQIHGYLTKYLLPDTFNKIGGAAKASKDPIGFLRTMYQIQRDEIPSYFKSSPSLQPNLRKNRLNLDNPNGEFQYAKEIVDRESRGEIRRKGSKKSKSTNNASTSNNDELKTNNGRGNKLTNAVTRVKNKLTGKGGSTTKPINTTTANKKSNNKNILTNKKAEIVTKVEQPNVTLNNYMEDTSSRINNALDIEYMKENLSVNFDRMVSLLEDIKDSSRETAENTKIISEKETPVITVKDSNPESNITVNENTLNSTGINKTDNGDFFLGNRSNSNKDPYANLKTKILEIARG